MYTYICITCIIYICMYVCNACMYVCMRVYIYIYLFRYIYAYTFVHTHVQVHDFKLNWPHQSMPHPLAGEWTHYIPVKWLAGFAFKIPTCLVSPYFYLSLYFSLYPTVAISVYLRVELSRIYIYLYLAIPYYTYISTYIYLHSSRSIWVCIDPSESM
jgi:hypothetical protein